MAMMKLSVLVLSVVLALPTSQAQDVNCVPQEIPASLFNCSSIDSVYLSCACDVYKTSILEIMAYVSCFIPPSSTDIQTQVSQMIGTVDTKSLIDGVINGGLSMETLVSSMAITQTSTSQIEIFTLILNITAKVGEDVFNKLCASVAPLSQCVNSNFMTSTKPDDMTLRALFNLDHVGTFLTQMCALKSELYAEKKCLTDSILPVGVCAYLPSIWQSSSMTFPLFSGTPISDAEINYICPAAGDFFRCAAIQVAPCSSNLAAMVNTLTKDLLATACSNLAVEGTQYPTTSPLLLCGAVHVTKALPLVLTIDALPSSPTIYQIQTMVEDGIRLACGVLPDYLMCVVNEMPSARSRYDVFIEELVDFKQFTYGKAIADHICQPERITAITSMLPCVMTMLAGVEACATSDRIKAFETFNITNLGHDANNDRQEFCGPIKDIAMCLIDTAIVPCDANVGAFLKETYFWMMQTDCYGARNGTFQQVIDQQNGGTPVAIGNARIYWLGVLLGSVIMYWA